MILTLIIILSYTYMLSVSFLSLELSKHLFDSITSNVIHAWQDNLARQLPSLCMQERRLLRGQNTIYRKKNTHTHTHTQKRLKGWEPEFKGTGGEAYTTSSPPPYLSLGPTHIYRNRITITLPEQTGRQNRSAYFTFRAAPSEEYISSLISSQ